MGGIIGFVLLFALAIMAGLWGYQRFLKPPCDCGH